MARGVEVADVLGRVGDPLGAGARALDQLEQDGEYASRVLRALEQREADLRRQLGSLPIAPDDPVTAAEAAARQRSLMDELRDVERRVGEALESWRLHQATAAACLEEAAAWVRAQAPTSGADQLFESVGGWFGRIRTVVEGVAEGVDRVVEGMQAWAVVARRTLLTRVRQVQLMVYGQVVGTWRRVDVFTTTTYTLFRRQAPLWLARLQGALNRVTPTLRVAGRLVTGVGAVVSGYDRFQRDEHRPDTTSTERWLRAGVEATARGIPIGVAGVASKKLIAGSVVLAAGSLGLGLVLVPLAVGASGALIYYADRFGDWLTTSLLDEWTWSQELIRDVADVLDAGGRLARDGYLAVANDVDAVVDMTVEGVGAARDWAADLVGSARDNVESALGSVSDRAEGMRWRDTVPRARPVSLPLSGGGWLGW